MYDAHHSELLAAWGSRGAATRRSWSVPCVDPRSAGPARVEPLAWRRCRIGLWRFGLVVSWPISWLTRPSFRRLLTRPQAMLAQGRSPLGPGAGTAAAMLRGSSTHPTRPREHWGKGG